MIYHMAHKSDWSAAQQDGHYPWSSRDLLITDEGFLHCSGSLDQVARVHDAIYADDPEPLVLLHLNDDDLAAAGLEVRWESAVPGRADSEVFTHVYGGDLPVAAVSSAVPLVEVLG